MDSQKTTALAIKRHDIDASHFQGTYKKEGKNHEQTNREALFLYGRKLVMDELYILLETIPKGSRILDVGCGTAHLTQWIKDRGYEVYGIEPSLEMYNYARQNFPDIEIKQAISSSIPYPENYFDLIVSFEVLRYLDKAENIKSYHEFNRVLKPGGQFFVTQVNLFSTDFYYFFHQLKALYCSFTKKVHHHCNFTTPAREEAMVKAAGFSQVETIGRFIASNRLFYKFGKGIGQAYSGLMEKVFGRQRFASSPYKNLTGHLIVIGKK